MIRKNTSDARRPRMSLMGHRKGIELALNAVVIIAILLLVAVVIISFFLGVTGKAFGPLSDWITGGTGKVTEACRELGTCPPEEETTSSSHLKILTEDRGTALTKLFIIS